MIDRLPNDASPLSTTLSLLAGFRVLGENKRILSTCVSLRTTPAPWIARVRDKPLPHLRTRLRKSPHAMRWIDSGDFMRGRTHWPLPVRGAFKYGLVPTPIEFAKVRHRGVFLRGRPERQRLGVRCATAYGCGAKLSVLGECLDLPRASVETRLEEAAFGLADDLRTLLWLVSPDWRRVSLPTSVWEPWRDRWESLYDPFQFSAKDVETLTTPRVLGALLEQPRLSRLIAPHWGLPYG